MTKPTITVQDLNREGACQNQVWLFRQRFGKKTKITKAKARRFGNTFDSNWAGANLLSGEWLRRFREGKSHFLRKVTRHIDQLTIPHTVAYAQAIQPLDDELLTLTKKRLTKRESIILRDERIKELKAQKVQLSRNLRRTQAQLRTPCHEVYRIKLALLFVKCYRRQWKEQHP